MPPITFSPGLWVDAAPFRAHLRHVMAVGDLSIEVVAALTGINPRAAAHLLDGRAGRPVRRISADVGRRLLQLTSFDARTVRWRLVPARMTRARLRELVAEGHGIDELASRTGVDGQTLRELLDRQRDACTSLVAARVGALHAALEARYDLIYSLAS
jgi:hypothetical protein